MVKEEKRKISHRQGNLRRGAVLLVDGDAVPAIGDGKGDKDGARTTTVISYA
jgi:hypothetical protein